MELDAQSLARFKKNRILVVGDVMLDRYWYGAVDRISPEAPVPVVAVDQTEMRVGGAANVALNVTSAGGNCTLLSVIGNDEAGQQLREILSTSLIDDQIASDDKTSTTVKLRVISRNQQLLRADFENKPSDELLDQCLKTYVERLDEADAVILSDYGKGGLSHIEKMIDVANTKKVPVYVDPKGADFSRYRGATFVTPNLREFEQATETVEDDDHMADLAQSLMARHNIKSILVTLSERGMMLHHLGDDPIYSHARTREVYDVSGAGDTVIAMLAMAGASKFKDIDALMLANCAAGIVVSKLGTSTVSADELAVAVERELAA